MRTARRRRRYLPPRRLSICRPLIEYDDARDAFILRAVGDRLGPVLRADRRRDGAPAYTGAERRGVARTARSQRGWALPR
jgi:hypothetical protein